MLSVIVSYYKNIPNLELILLGFENQSDKRFEVIVSEDDCDVDTATYISKAKERFNFPIHHLRQESDNGFRKNEMLNKSIQNANFDYVAFIDGDCIPHKHFVKEYIKHLKPNTILYGRRANLGEKISSELLSTKNLGILKYSKLVFTDSDSVKDAIYSPSIRLSYKERGLVGCNWAVQKQHLFDVNGFDEDYTYPGVGEDVDIEWRLKAIGLHMFSMKYKAIVYHIYHPRSYNETGVQKNYDILKSKQDNDLVQCLNGIMKH